MIWEHQLTNGLTRSCVPWARQVTGAAYDPELREEQQPLVGGESRPPSPPRAPLDMPPPLVRAHTEHPAALPDARQGDCSCGTSSHMRTDTACAPCCLTGHMVFQMRRQWGSWCGHAEHWMPLSHKLLTASVLKTMSV